MDDGNVTELPVNPMPTEEELDAAKVDMLDHWRERNANMLIAHALGYGRWIIAGVSGTNESAVAYVTDDMTLRQAKDLLGAGGHLDDFQEA